MVEDAIKLEGNKQEVLVYSDSSFEVDIDNNG